MSDRETGSDPSLEGPSEAASWREPSCEPWVTWPQGWGSEVTTVTKWPCPPSPVPLLLSPPPPPTHPTPSHKCFSGTFFVWNAPPCCLISWEGCNKSPPVGELQQKYPDSGGQSLRSGGSQGQGPCRGSEEGSRLPLPAPGGSRHPWLVATSLPSLPPS